MKSELSRELDLLSSRLATLLERHAELRRSEQRLLTRVNELEGVVERLRAENVQLQRSSEIQSAAVAFGPDSADSRAARKIISQVVREIDNCIALLRN